VEFPQLNSNSPESGSNEPALGVNVESDSIIRPFYRQSFAFETAPWRSCGWAKYQAIPFNPAIDTLFVHEGDFLKDLARYCASGLDTLRYVTLHLVHALSGDRYALNRYNDVIALVRLFLVTPSLRLLCICLPAAEGNERDMLVKHQNLRRSY
jgi:hypothetical protein